MPTRPLRPARPLVPLLAAALLAPAAWCPPARAAEPAASPKPFPAIEAGMHTAPIRRIAVDRAGRWAVTASDDKTARIWNLATGQLERVLRVPLGEGDEGKLYAVALSPDGALVALGGFTGPFGEPKAIYLFDRSSGRLLQRFTGSPSNVFHLAFAADGRRLAAALEKGGIRGYGATGQGAWAQVAADGEYGADSYSVEFDAAGRLLATSLDGELRLYGAGGSGRLQPLVRRAAPGGKRPFIARFSPDGRRIAVGFDDSPAVAVLDGTSLEPLAPADTSSITNGNFYGLAWSADGRRLLAAGRYSQDDGSYPLVVWPAGGGAPQRLPLGMTNTVMDLRPLADGRLVYAGGDPAWGVLDPQLRPTKVFAGPPVLDHRSDAMKDRPRTDGFQSFRQAPDGRWLEFRAVGRSAQGPTARLVRFDLAQRRLLLPGAAAPGGQAPRSTGLPIEGWQNTTSPTLAGKPLPLTPYETSRSLAISADGSAFALGSEWAVRVFEADGRQRWRTSTPGTAWLVNLSADGRFVVAALGDGTIRWYRSSDGSQVLALYVHPDGQRWMQWTPEGFYDASPGGAELFGYHLNNGRDQAGTFIRASQLQQKFFRPDLIARRLGGTADDEAAIARAVAEVGDVRTTLSTASLPPSLRLLSQRTLPDGDIEITYELNDQGGGLGPVELRLDGAVLEGRADPPVAGINRRRLRPPVGKSRLQLLAYSRSGVASSPVGLDLTGSTGAEPATLHLLAVGITNYRDGSLRRGVRFASGDAVAFREALTAAGRASTARVAEPVLLRDEQASGERIRLELTAMAQRVKPADLFVLYLAGHGVSTDQGEYVFLPQDLLYRNSESLAAGGLGGNELRTLLARIPSTKTVVVLDTCSSGAFGLSGRSLGEKGAIDRLSRLSGRVVLAAAGDQRMALESPDNQRGIFTGALLRALAGEADSNRDGLVGVREVADYVEQEVQRITRELFKYEQTPMSDLRGQNFPLSKSGGRP
ncbi:MAG: caspase family protein [Cyanobium sp.]